jgi:hypothetical protein
VCHCLRVLLLRQWIDRAELLAPALQTLHPSGERLHLLTVERPHLLGSRLL